MLKRSFLVIVIFLFIITGYSQFKDNDSYSILWKIENPKKPNTASFILGTTHTIYPYLIGDSIVYLLDSVLDCTNVFIAENILESDTASRNAFIAKLKKPFIHPKSLWPENSKKIKSYFNEKLNWSEEQLNTLADSSLDQILLLGQMQSNLYEYYFRKANIPLTMSAASMDSKILAEANKRHKKLIGLDHMDELAVMYNNNTFNKLIGIDIDLIFRELEASEKNPQKLDASEFDAMSKGLFIYHENPKVADLDYYNLLPNRNEQWMQLIIHEMKNNECLIVVGSGHLNYASGLLNNFIKRGYKISPIPIITNRNLDEVIRIP